MDSKIRVSKKVTLILLAILSALIFFLGLNKVYLWNLDREITDWEARYESSGISLILTPTDISPLLGSPSGGNIAISRHFLIYARTRLGVSRPSVLSWSTSSIEMVQKEIESLNIDRKLALQTATYFNLRDFDPDQSTLFIPYTNYMDVNGYDQAVFQMALASILYALDSDKEKSLICLFSALKLSRSVVDYSAIKRSHSPQAQGVFMANVIKFLRRVLPDQEKAFAQMIKVATAKLTVKIPPSKFEYDLYSNLQCSRQYDDPSMDRVILPRFLNRFLNRKSILLFEAKKKYSGRPKSTAMKQLYLLSLKEYYAPIVSWRRNPDDQLPTLPAIHRTAHKRVLEGLPNLLEGSQVMAMHVRFQAEYDSQESSGFWRQCLLSAL